MTGDQRGSTIPVTAERQHLGNGNTGGVVWRGGHRPRSTCPCRRPGADVARPRARRRRRRSRPPCPTGQPDDTRDRFGPQGFEHDLLDLPRLGRGWRPSPHVRGSAARASHRGVRVHGNSPARTNLEMEVGHAGRVPPVSPTYPMIIPTLLDPPLEPLVGAEVGVVVPIAVVALERDRDPTQDVVAVRDKKPPITACNGVPVGASMSTP